MAPDAMPSPASNAPTPFFTPVASGTNTPLPQQNGGLGDYLSAPLGKGSHFKVKTYLAGCKALDSLVKLIASTESFFHPTNSGSWTGDVSSTQRYLTRAHAHVVFLRSLAHSSSTSYTTLIDVCSVYNTLAWLLSDSALRLERRAETGL